MVMTLIVAFIAAAIMLSLGVSILGNTSNGFDCTQLSGNSTDGWQKICNDVASQQQSSFNLLVIILVVISAVAILIVVRMLY